MYNTTKTLERAVKRVASAGQRGGGGGGISAVPPHDYAARFLSFMRRVFI